MLSAKIRGFVEKIRALLRGQTTVKIVVIAAAVALFLGVSGSGTFASFVQYSNTMDFCLSCHEMRDTAYVEYKETTHFKSRSGVRPSCADCHVPSSNWIKTVGHKVVATNQLVHHLLGTVNTPEKFEARRLRLAKTVWRQMEASDSETCRGCHSTEAWDLSLQKARARGQHEDAEVSGETCIDCHKGIAHKDIHEDDVETVTEEEGEDFDPFALE